jgi:hypothetical protein
VVRDPGRSAPQLAARGCRNVPGGASCTPFCTPSEPLILKGNSKLYPGFRSTRYFRGVGRSEENNIHLVFYRYYSLNSALDRGTFAQKRGKDRNFRPSPVKNGHKWLSVRTQYPSILYYIVLVIQKSTFGWGPDTGTRLTTDFI